MEAVPHTHQFRTYSAKLLLFGEYTVIQGSQALAIPFPTYTSAWDDHPHFETALQNIPTTQKQNSNQALLGLLRALQTQQLAGLLSPYWNLTQFETDLLQNQRWFYSSIPTGYGAGSSGAVCAAVYDRYYTGPNSDILTLQKTLAQIESHFHGASSGLDPLVTFLDRPILRHQQRLSQVEIPKFSAFKPSFFLVDTQIPRQTAPLVQIYLERCKEAHYAQRCEQILADASNRAIQAFMQASNKELLQAFFDISTFQHAHFQAMIPPEFQAHWTQGLQQKHYALKLCGAGGGGFLLGLTQHKAATQAAFKGHPILFL